MLVLTDKHLMFVHKTESKMKWWKAITQRQVINFIKSKNTMIRHDGYDEEELMNDVEDNRNIELAFDDISSISFEEKVWGSVLQLEYEKDGKKEKISICNSTRLGKISYKRAYKIHEGRLEAFCEIY